MDKKGRLEYNVEITIHICFWAYIFVSPLIFVRGGEEIDWGRYFQRLYFPLSSCAVFYLNYFYFIPRYVLHNKRYGHFALYNILLIVVLMLSRDYYVTLLPPIEPEMGSRPHRRPNVDDHHWFFQAMFVLRNFLSLAFLVFLATVVKLSVQWRKAEVARQQAELGRSEAELMNLKNQINPHFLLNTLNNIYALTAFDADQAQQAISRLSRLLRYVLYENQAPQVSLRKEVEFLHTYIELMRIRLTDNVKIDVQMNLPPDDDRPVAPLIFISLVENAFKHGVSPTQPSFIHIALQVDDDGLHFCCRNSNFPKAAGDKSPGGIGLTQVQRRLDYSYPGRYTWHYGVDGDTYYSQIDIH